jgi:hypothetical protein
MSNFWVLLIYLQTVLENFMISRIARLSLASLISIAIGITPISVMAADPALAPAPVAAPAAAPAVAPTEQSAEKSAKKKTKKEKKAEKKAKKKSKKKAKPVADTATQ